MRLLFDTNILIDAAVQSRDYHDAANQLLIHAERGDIDGLMTPMAIATCWYVSTLDRSSSACRRPSVLPKWDGRL